MNTFILLLILASPNGLTSVEREVQGDTVSDCTEQGEDKLGTWIESGNTRYLVTGYICRGEDGVRASHTTQ